MACSFNSLHLLCLKDSAGPNWFPSASASGPEELSRALLMCACEPECVGAPTSTHASPEMWWAKMDLVLCRLEVREEGGFCFAGSFCYFQPYMEKKKLQFSPR